MLLLLGAGRAGASSAVARAYRVVGLILEQTQPPEDAHGPQLCLGVIPAIYPPRCAGIDIAGWDWAAVADELSFNGATWGRYVVTGTFDGSTITLTRPPRRAAPGDGALDIPSPIPERGAGARRGMDPQRPGEPELERGCSALPR